MMDFSEKIALLFRSGPVVQFRCIPSAVVTGPSREIQIEAIVFRSEGSSSLAPGSASLQPFVTCEGDRRLEMKLTLQKAGPSPTFAARLNAAMLKAGSYDFLLHLHPNGDSVAMARLHVFDASDIRQALPPA